MCHCHTLQVELVNVIRLQHFSHHLFSLSSFFPSIFLETLCDDLSSMDILLEFSLFLFVPSHISVTFHLWTLASYHGWYYWRWLVVQDHEPGTVILVLASFGPELFDSPSVSHCLDAPSALLLLVFSPPLLLSPLLVPSRDLTVNWCPLFSTCQRTLPMFWLMRTHTGSSLCMYLLNVWMDKRETGPESHAQDLHFH